MSACSRAGAATATSPRGRRNPPKADVIPKQLELFGRVRVDPYYWLNDRTNPKVKAYLEAENAYTDALMVSHQGLATFALRRDRGPDQASRRDGPCFRQWLLLLHAV